MQLVGKINRSRNFQLLGSEIFSHFDNRFNKIELFDKRLKLIKILDLEKKVHFCGKSNDRLVFETNDSSFYLLINSASMDSVLIKKKGVWDQIINNIIVTRKEERIYLGELCDIEILIEEYDHNVLYIDSDFVLFNLNKGLYEYTKNGFFCISKKTLKKLYQSDLTQYTAYKTYPHEQEFKDGRILEFLGVYDNTLWLTTTNHNLFGIDVKTGEILDHFRDIPELKNGNYKFDVIGYGPRHETKLLKDEGVIIGLTLSMSWQLDLISKEFTFIDLRSQLGKSATMTNVLSIDLEEAWFTSEPERDELRVGHLNRIINKITTWKCKDLDADMGLVFNIVRKDEMVYMLDQGKRLYAFQLEEGELNLPA